MVIESQGKTPSISAQSSVASTAVISGDVTIAANCRIGHGVVIVAEGGPIEIGEHCVVMDTAVIRGVPGHVTRLGRHVLVGPRAYLVGCEVEDNVFLATGSTVFNGARIGKGAEVRINGLVHLRSTLAPDETVPIGWIAVGTPATILPPDAHDRVWAIQKALDFPKYVFSLDRPPAGETVMPKMMQRYTESLIKRHASDQVVDASIDMDR